MNGDYVQRLRALLMREPGIFSIQEERDLRAALDELEQLRPAPEVIWLAQDGEGNFGVWHDPDNARRQIIQDRGGEDPGVYEWVNDADRTHELLLRDDEVTGLTLWMACVADAATQQPEREGGARWTS